MVTPSGVGCRQSGILGWRFLAVFCFLVSPLSFFPVILPASAAITPERDVIVSDTREEPAWKILWDEARELTRQEKYTEAAKSYSRLLSLKNNIEEASWDYCLLLITLSDWDQASVHLEYLLEKDPKHPENLLR
ncbi:MAG: tetratricopeptide repeat protein, partial [Desulfocapsaceae bacterium]|nr:tetratricopeptide repeat protein [Desulfocapsaceae bacterium]